MKKIRFAFFLFVMLASCSEEKGLHFDWLAGKWKGQVSEISYYEEWKKNSPELMSGSSFIIQGGDTVYRDKLKIELIGETPCFIITLPDTKEPVIFKMTGGRGREAIFENHEHEFPGLIAYGIEGDSLHVRFEGIKENKKVREEMFYHKR